MSPNKKLGDYFSRSKTILNLKSEDDHFPGNDSSESILHRLRPRIGLRVIPYKTVDKAFAPKKRRKRNKRCFIDRTIRRFEKNRNLRAIASHESTGNVNTSRTIKNLDTSVEKSISFVNFVRDYVFSAIKEGNKDFVKTINRHTRRFFGSFQGRDGRRNTCTRLLSGLITSLP